MEKRSLFIAFTAYPDLSELKPEWADLLEQAKAALAKSYAPYSGFHVGAAALLSNGKTVSGANFENASYPLCLCAERVTLAAAAADYPHVPVIALAITASNPKKKLSFPIPPCGACRQVLSEVEDLHHQSMTLILQGEEGEILVFDAAKDLLPNGFSGEYL